MLTKTLISSALIAGAVMGAAPAQAQNQDTVAQFADAVNAVASTYNTGHIPVYVDYIEDEYTIAESNGYSITLNSQWADLSPSRFNSIVAQDIASGFTPGGCPGIQALAIHEMGHVIDRQGGRAARSAVSRSGQISGLHSYAYESGVLDAGEAVAISFQATVCGSATPVERSIYDLMFSQ